MLQNIGDDRTVAEACYGLANLALSQGDEERAASLFGASLALADGIDDKIKVADTFEGLAEVAVRRDQAERAALVLGAAAALRDQINAPVAAHRRSRHASVLAATRAGLNAEQFAAAWDAGQRRPLEQTISEARGMAEMLAIPPS